MTEKTGSRPTDENDCETIEDIENAADAISTEHIAARLHQLLADSILTHLREFDPSDQLSAPPPAGPGYVDAADVDHLAALLQATQRQLTNAQAELHAVNIERSKALHDVSCANVILSRTLQRAEEASTSADAYLDTVLERSQEILDTAHATARRIVAAATAQADEIVVGAAEQKSLAGGHVRGPQPH